jgi:hypothetical protein
MDTDMRRSLFGVDPICVHPWNPWLKQVFHSILSRLNPLILKESSLHNVSVVNADSRWKSGRTTP